MVEAARRRHAPALRRYAFELRADDRTEIDRALAATWEAFARQTELESAERQAEWLFADLRRRVVAGVRGGGLADDRTEADDVSAEAIFARLTPKQQEVLHLKFGPGFTHEQIARILDLAPAAAAQLLHVALTRLAAAFRRTGADPVKGLRGDDPRLTLAALGELDGAAWRAWEAAQTDTVAINERLEEVRRAAKWVPGHLTSRRRHTRSKPPHRRRRALLIGVGILALAGVGVVFLRPDGNASEPSVASTAAAAPPSRAAGVAVQTRASERTSPPETQTSPGAAEPASLGVFRPTEPPPAVNGSREPAAARRGAIASEATGTAAPAAVARGEFLPVQPQDAARVAAEREASPPASAPAVVPADDTDLAPILALKRALGEGRWPRPEEVDAARLAAYFQRAAPRGERAMLFTQQFEAAPAPWDAQSVLLRAVAHAPEAPPAVRAPANVILLLDVSGSMDAPNRLPLALEAVRGLLDRLRPDDRVGLVTYAGESQVLHAPAPLAEATGLHAVLPGLTARGRTNGGAGLAEAFALARSERAASGEQRVILCTDGEFNMGATGPEELAALVRAAAASGVRLGIFGFGRSGAIDPRLEQLAALGGGGSGYVNTRADAVRVLLGQLGELVSPVATDVRLTLASSESVVAGAHAAALLPAEAIAALAEVGPGESVEATLEYRLAARGEPRFETTAARGAVREFATASAEFRFAAAVHRFAVLLAGPPGRALSELDDLEAWARAAVDDAGGYRAEFLVLVAQARAAAQAAVR